MVEDNGVETPEKVAATEGLFAPRIPKPSDIPSVSKKVEAEADVRLGLPESVRVETASAPMALEPAVANSSGPWVVYTGIATVRTIDSKGWAKAGIRSGLRVQWNYLNKMRQPASRFSKVELHYLLEVDGRFVLVED